MKQINMIIKLVMLTIFLFSVVTMVGCGRVNKENYDKIKIGMKYDEVIEILGEPDTCEEPVLKTKNCIWGSSDKQIKIKFLVDMVAWRSSKGLYPERS